MRKLTTWLCLWLIVTAAVQQSFADTILLNDGEKLEGKIIAESPTQVTIEWRVGGVIDERTVLRSEIKTLEKEPPDEADFRPLKNWKPGQNWLHPEDNDAAIAQFKSFIHHYPLSTHLAEAHDALDGFNRERNRAVAGEVKFHGKWLSSDQASEQKEDILAEAYFDSMKDASARGDFVGALNHFNTIETRFPGARIFPDAIELARRVVAALEPEIERRLRTVKADYDKLKEDWKTMLEQQRTDIGTALKRENAHLDAVFAASEAAKQKWAPFQPRSQRSLDKLKATAATEKTRLATLPVQKMRDSIKHSSTAANQLTARDVSGAENELKLALTDWPQNASAQRIGREIAARKAGDTKTTDTPKATPTPVPKTTPKGTPVPSPTPKKKSWFSFGAITSVGALLQSKI